MLLIHHQQPDPCKRKKGLSDDCLHRACALAYDVDAGGHGIALHATSVEVKDFLALSTGFGISLHGSDASTLGEHDAEFSRGIGPIRPFVEIREGDEERLVGEQC